MGIIPRQLKCKRTGKCTVGLEAWGWGWRGIIGWGSSCLAGGRGVGWRGGR